MPKSLRICFVGDSFVNGTGDPACLGWTGRICADMCSQGHDLTYYNLGIRRETSSDIRIRWQAEVEPRLPPAFASALVFSFGVNDTTLEKGNPRVAYELTLENTAAILSKAKKNHTVLFVGPPPVVAAEQNVRIGALCTGLQQTCERLGVPYLPVFEKLMDTPVWRREASDNDGAHPHTGGYSALAAIIQQWPEWQRCFE